MQAFLERHGPFTCLVDGANVAMYGQNWEDGSTGERGGFRFEQIQAVMEQIRRERPHLKPLLVQTPFLFCHMHCKVSILRHRTSGAATC